MAWEVVWTSTCFRDLEQAYQYIALDSAVYAQSLAEDVVERARWLGRNAEMGSKVPEFDLEEIREVRVGRYRLIYRLEPGRVTLLGLIHGARDLAAMWKEESRLR